MANKKGIADSIRHFTPAWFAVNMGTGAVSTLISVFPYGQHSDPFKAVSTAVFILNVFLFILFIAVTVTRYARYPDLWSLMIRHPVQSLYISTFPMGAITLITFGITAIQGYYGFGGRSFLFTLWVLWWIDVAISAICCWGLIHVMTTKHNHSLDEMTSVWLLPVITLIVASSAGGELALALHPYSVTSALTTLAFAAFMVSVGLTLAFMTLTIYLHRLILHGFPPGVNIISSFIPLGPMGQAGISILLIGQSMKESLPVTGSSSPFLSSTQAGEIVFAISVCASYFLWALATMWLGYALLGMQHILRRTRIPFKLSFWGMIFPNGVYANLTVNLYQALDVPFFRVWGAIYSVFTITLWMVVFYRTATLVPRGRIFDAPCIEDMNTERNLPGPLMESERGEHSPVTKETVEGGC